MIRVGLALTFVIGAIAFAPQQAQALPGAAPAVTTEVPTAIPAQFVQYRAYRVRRPHRYRYGYYSYGYRYPRGWYPGKGLRAYGWYPGKGLCEERMRFEYCR